MLSSRRMTVEDTETTAFPSKKVQNTSMRLRMPPRTITEMYSPALCTIPPIRALLRALILEESVHLTTMTHILEKGTNRTTIVPMTIIIEETEIDTDMMTMTDGKITITTTDTEEITEDDCILFVTEYKFIILCNLFCS